MSRLPGVFADAGALCADEDVLDDGFAALVEQVPADVVFDALCRAAPDTFGWCSDCGARVHALDRPGHKRGGEGCFRGALLLVPFVAVAGVRAFVRRLVVHLSSSATSPNRGGGEGRSVSVPPAALSAPSSPSPDLSAAAGNGAVPSPSRLSARTGRGGTDHHACSVCGLPVDRDDAHWPHDPDCPGRRPWAGSVRCVCDRPTHPDCCPDCRGETR